jgi:hypothetical protein
METRRSSIMLNAYFAPKIHSTQARLHWVISLSLLGVARTFAQGDVPPAVSISKTATPGVAGYTTYAFEITPAPATSISAVDGEFLSDVGAIRQVNPFNLPTVFNNNNGAIVQAGEDPLADSQFGFHSNDATLVINSAESNSGLRAILGGLKSPRTERFSLAHVVLADGASGTWQIGVLQRDATGVEREFSESGMFGVAEPMLTGDYNADGTVDAADYVLWRDTLGLAGSELAADGNGNDEIDAGDYEIWRANFGRTVGDSELASRAVPEPASLMTLLIGTMIVRVRARGVRNSAFKRP